MAQLASKKKHHKQHGRLLVLLAPQFGEIN
jgi:hypothetical protein